MSGKRSLEKELTAVYALREQPLSDQVVGELRRALARKNNHLVATAAQVAGEREIAALEPDLVQAFGRFMADPLKTDKGCAAKAAIAEALYQIGAIQEGLFLQGIRHVQLEPVYGGRQDTAARLRGVCAMALVRMGYPQVMIELAYLLADHELDARIAAVRAIAYGRSEAGVPLLRFKVLGGDDDPRVLYECFGALLKLAPETSLPFVAGFLDHANAAIAEGAALALGESRLSEAFEFLRTAWGSMFDPDRRNAVLLAIAMLRSEQALDFLLALVADAPLAVANEAIAALRIYERDEKVWRRVREVAGGRGDVEC
jgi:HEAT repeat protein